LENARKEVYNMLKLKMFVCYIINCYGQIIVDFVARMLSTF